MLTFLHERRNYVESRKAEIVSKEPGQVQGHKFNLTHDGFPNLAVVTVSWSLQWKNLVLVG